MTDKKDVKKTENKDTKKDEGQKKGKGTLSLGGTLGAKSSGGTLSVGNRSNSGASAVVEVRRRRFGEKASSNSQTPVNEEIEQRLKVLEEAKKNAEEEQKRREAERKVAKDLTSDRVAESERKQEEEKRKQQEEEKRKLEEELAEQRRIAEEQAAAQAAEAAQAEGRVKATTKVGGFAAPATGERTERKREAEEASRSTRPVGKDRDIARKRGGRNAYLEELETRFRTSTRRKQRKSTPQSQKQQEKITREVTIPEAITVQELAARMSERGAAVVKKFMQMGQMVTLNQILDRDSAAVIVEEFGHTYKMVSDADVEEGLTGVDDKPEDMITRPPVVTVMGHVDHGKTTLLDTIRRTAVAGGEAGGITQHIGAYQAQTPSGRKITFLDTPGHAAFTAMRARGAAVTDVVILVVAADDGVMPQTVEAIKHAKAAGVPIVVAVNKCDKPEADPMRVKNELLNHDLVAEEYGGDAVFVHVSAKEGTGIEELEEMVLLQADVLDLQANPNRRAEGVTVESQLDKGRGAVATVIVNRGTLKVGDILVAGSTWGRVRALVNDQGQRVDEAGPAMPVEILGLQGVPEAGDDFVVVENEKKAREVAEYRDKKKRDAEQAARSGRTLEALMAGAMDGERKELGVIVKGDVQGSVEAICDAMKKLSTEKISVKVIHSAVGVITESDVMLATASDALIIGFNVRAGAQARDLAEREGIELRYYNIIYNLIDDVKAAMGGLLSPKIEENMLGNAEIRETFHVSKIGTIAGCMVTDGLIRRNAKVRLIRDGVVIHEGELASLKRFKDDAKEVQSGYECGLSLAKYNDLKEGDVVECYELVETTMTLDEVKAAEDTAAAKKEKEKSDEQESA